MTWRTLKADLSASFIVFLLALPLSLGVALASGAPIASGLISAAAGGILGGIFSGSPFIVSGPTAGLTVFIFYLYENFDFLSVCLITVLAGIFQIVFGFLGIARFCRVISPSVLRGMLSAIGIMLIMGQVHVILGHHPASSVWKNLYTLPTAFLTSQAAAVWISLLTVGCVVCIDYGPFRKLPFPSAIVAIVLSVFCSYIWKIQIPHIQLPDVFHLPSWQLADLNLGSWSVLTDILWQSSMLAAIASAESMLSAISLDKIHPGKRSDLNQELVAQGIANVASGFCGGLPLTGVIVRSKANVEAGAKTRVATILHGCWMLVAMGLLKPALCLIPLSCLAALLVMVGFKLIQFDIKEDLNPFREGLIFFSTILGIISSNVLFGILLGLGVNALLLALKVAYTKSYIHPKLSVQTFDDKSYTIEMTGTLTFLYVPQLNLFLEQLPEQKCLKLRIKTLSMDHTVQASIRSFAKNYQLNGGEITIHWPTPNTARKKVNHAIEVS